MTKKQEPKVTLTPKPEPDPRDRNIFKQSAKQAQQGTAPSQVTLPPNPNKP